jgi:hypothetical protein
MKYNFIEGDTLDWMLITQRRKKDGGQGSTTHHNPGLILSRHAKSLKFNFTNPELGEVIEFYLPGIKR